MIAFKRKYIALRMKHYFFPNSQNMYMICYEFVRNHYALIKDVIEKVDVPDYYAFNLMYKRLKKHFSFCSDKTINSKKILIFLMKYF